MNHDKENCRLCAEFDALKWAKENAPEEHYSAIEEVYNQAEYYNTLYCSVLGKAMDGESISFKHKGKYVIYEKA